MQFNGLKTTMKLQEKEEKEHKWSPRDVSVAAKFKRA